MKVSALRSLQTRLMGITFVLVIALLGLVLWRWATSQRELLRRELHDRSRVMARVVADAFQNEVVDRNWAQIQLGLEVLVIADASLVHALVYDERGEISAAFPQEYVSHFVPDHVPVAVSDLLVSGADRHAVLETFLLRDVRFRGEERGRAGDRIFDAATNVTNPSMRTRQGVLRLGVSQRAVEAAVREAVSGVLRLGVGALLVGVAGAFLLARFITRPIQDLARRASRIREGDLAVEFPVDRRDEIGALEQAMGEMVLGLRDRDFIRDVFGRYVTPELADELLVNRDRLELGGHLQRVTMMMSDLRGFTSLSERLDPHAMMSLLNAYLSEMTRVILDHRGTINEFIGDAIFALFGAPIERGDDTNRAVRCAIAMQLALADLNLRHAARGLPELEMGIGINTGQVIAGNIGSEQRVKYGVVGDAVNLTGRVESMTTGAQVLLSEACYQAVRDEVEVLGPRRASVKGKSEEIVFYELLAVRRDGVELRMPTRIDPRRVVQLVVCIDRLVGKEVSSESFGGTVTELGAKTAILDAEEHLTPLENLRLRFALGPRRETGDVYAKVEASENTTAGARATMVFTSFPDADRRTVETYLAGDP